MNVENMCAFAPAEPSVGLIDDLGFENAVRDRMRAKRLAGERELIMERARNECADADAALHSADIRVQQLVARRGVQSRLCVLAPDEYVLVTVTHPNCTPLFQSFGRTGLPRASI